MKELRRVISLPLITFYGIGSILGAGIYVLISKIAGISGMYMPVSFIIAGIVAGFSAFSYAELSSRYPKSAGEAVYLYEAFSLKELSSLLGWAIVIVGIVSVATLANGIVGYVAIFLELPGWVIKLSIITLLFLVAIWGVVESLLITAIITVLEIFGVLLVIFYGFESLLTIGERWHELIPPLNSNYIFPLIFGAFLSFYAYIGFEDMVNMAEEVKNPKRNMPVSIILVLFITTILYVLVSLVAVLSVPLEYLSKSTAPFTDIIKNSSNFPVWIMGLISVVAVLNGMLIQIIMGSRVLYGMSRANMAPAIFSYIYPKTRTPVVTTAFVYLVIVLFALLLPLVSLAKITSSIILVVFSCVNLSLVFIKISESKNGNTKNSQHFKVPILIPCTGFILCTCFLILQLKEFF